MQQTTDLPAQGNQPKMRRTLLGKVPVVSPLYKLHPVTRLFTLLFLGIISLFILTPWINILLIVLILLYLMWAKVDISGLRIYLPLTITVAIFMFTVSTIFPGAKPGYHTFTFLGITFYLEVFYFTFCSYWRLMAMLFGTIQYFSTNRERDTLVAIRTLKIPFVVTYFFSLALRSAGMFLEDMLTIREAERARGLDESSMSLRDRAKLYGMYMIPLFTVAIRRTDEISNALYARGYTPSGNVEGGGKRTDYILTQYTVRSLDIFLITLMVVVFCVVGFLQTRYGLFSMENAPFYQYLLSLYP
jgi:energy-coupling factor transporter transmembrane protein EcfT